MAIVKRDHVLEEAKFVFDNSGEVVDVTLKVNYQLYDDVVDVEETRIRNTKSVWGSLTNGQQTQANVIGKKLKALAEDF